MSLRVLDHRRPPCSRPPSLAANRRPGACFRRFFENVEAGWWS
jgi:hypothetical protein